MSNEHSKDPSGTAAHAASLATPTVSWVPDAEMKRRSFMKAASLAAAGYALAVQPISAETISTPTTGLAAADITVARDGAAIPVYLARPEGGGKLPTLIVIHEIFGQHEHIRDVARRFAKEGFLVAAPELYFREGGVKNLKTIPEVLEVVRKIGDRQVLDDLGAVLKHVQGLPQSNGNVGATGFCWGGRATWLLGEDNSALKAGVAWYGPLGDFAPGPLHPRSVIAGAADLKCPVLGLYGAADQGIPLPQVEEMKAALQKAGKTFEVVVYPDTPHGFNADYRPSYRAEPAADGWKRATAWFRKYLS